MAITAESIVIDVIVDSVGAENSLKKLTDTFKKIGGSTSSANSGMDKTAKTMNKLSLGAGAAASGLAKISKALLSVATVKLVANALGDCITKANEYVESYNLFTVAMGSYANEAEDYAERVSDALGIDTAEWERAQGTIMTLVTGFGSVESRAYTMSKNLTQLGYDLSSFFNISVKDAMAKIESGIAGELEPLRRLGFDLSQAKLQAEATALGINKLVSEMTQAEKAELRYHAIMTQVTTAQTDMARTISSPANMLRVLKAQFEMLGRAIGSIFIPMLQKVLPPIIAVVKVLRQIATKIAEMLGYETPKFDSQSADSYSKSVDDTTESVKDLKRELMGFDEINKLGGNTDGLLDNGGSGFNFNLKEYDFLGKAINDEIDKIEQKIKAFLAKITPYLDEILLLVETIAVAFLAWKISSFLTNLIAAHGRLLAIIAGVVLLIAGVALVADGIYSWVKNGELSDEAFNKLAIGIIAAGVGLAILFKSMIPLAISGILLGIISIIKGFQDWNKTGELTYGMISQIIGGIVLVGASIAAIVALVASSTAAIPVLVGTAIIAALTGVGLMIAKFMTKIVALANTLRALKNNTDGTFNFKATYEEELKKAEAQKEADNARRAKETEDIKSPETDSLLKKIKDDMAKTKIDLDGLFEESKNNKPTTDTTSTSDLENTLKEMQSNAKNTTGDSIRKSLGEEIEKSKSLVDTASVNTPNNVATNSANLAGNSTISNLTSEEVETAVERGTYAGYSRALKENGSQPIQVTAHLNGRTLFEEIVNQNRTASKRYGKSPLSI